MSGFTLFGGISLSTPTGTSVVQVVPPQEVKEEEIEERVEESVAGESQEVQPTKRKKDRREGKTAFERILPKRVSYGKKQTKKNIRSCCIDGDLIKKIAVSAPPYVKFGNRGVEVGEEGNEAPPPAKKAKIMNNINNNNNNANNTNDNNIAPAANSAPKTQPVLTKFNIITEEEKLEAEMRKKEKAHAKNKRRRAAKQAAKRLAQQQQQQEQEQKEKEKENEDKK